MMGLALAVVLAQAYYTPTEAQAIFAQANEAYARADYPAARQGYEKLLAHGQGGADVLYNLGTTALASGDLGNAVLYLERARRAGSRAEDLEANLAVARSKQLDQVVGVTADEPFVERLVNATSETVVSWLFIGCWCGAFLLLLLRRIFPAIGRGWAVALAIILFVGAVPAGAVLAAHVYARENMVDGVVMAATLPARELPEDTAKVSFEIHAGLKVRLMEQVGSFVKIRLPNGLEGWVQRGGVVEI